MSDQQQSNPPTIRQARLDDAEGIGRVHSRSQHATYRGIVSDAHLARTTVEERSRWWTLALASHDGKPNWLDLVVEVGGEIVGFSCTGPVGRGAGSTVAAYDLYCLYVAPEWLRRGFGRALLERTFAWLRDRNVPDIQVLVLRGTQAYRFYEAMGGRLVEEGHHADDDGMMLPHRIYHYDLRTAAESSAAK
jgi:GNAT superfamily N-acetyltransferase